METFLQNHQALWTFTGLLLLGIFFALAASHLMLHAFRGMTQKVSASLARSIVTRARAPLRCLLPLLAMHLLLPFCPLPATYTEPFRHVLSLAIIAAVAWLAARGSWMLEDFIFSRYSIEDSDNLQARKIRTQFQVFKKLILFIITLVATAAMLMTFERVRQLGTALLASAGILGIVVGLATQRTVGTLLAGVQIALTQPIRVDDVVVVENEWGRIEEITLTHVVVRIWDLRRLILPITYFIEKPFQNWTRVTADVLGTVFIYADYSVPVQALRDALHRILKASEFWDRRTWALQVTGATERSLELRALVSAANASDAWNLRCEVREKLIEYIRENHPEGFPRVRAILDKDGQRETPPSVGAHE